MSALETIKQPLMRSRTFLEECWAEVKKVHFPTAKETRGATVVVLVGVIIVALYLGLVDFLLSRMITWILV